MVDARGLPQDVFSNMDWFVWRGVGLEESLRRELSPQAFHPWTLAPTFVTEAELARVQTAHVRWEAEPSGTWEAILLSIEERMREAGASWVVPDPLRRVSDVSWPSPPESVESFVVGQTPYYVSREASATLIEQVWRAAGNAAGTLGILTCADVPQRNAQPEQLPALVAAMTDVVVEAYDHSERAIFLTRNA